MKSSALVFFSVLTIIFFLTSCVKNEIVSYNHESQFIDDDIVYYEDSAVHPVEQEDDDDHINIDFDTDESQSLDEWTGLYQLEGSDISFIIYSESEEYFGYLHMEGRDETSYRDDRILAEIKGTQDMIHIFFLESCSDEENRGDLFHLYQEGDLLFSLQKESNQIVTVWGKMTLNEKQEDLERGFTLQEGSWLSMEIINEADKAYFLRAFNMIGATLFYQYYNDDGSLQLELYFDLEEKAGVGVYYGIISTYGFRVDEYESGVWQDHKFSVMKERYDVSILEEYKEYYTYNENNKVTHYYSEGIIEGWANSPFLDHAVKIEFSYRDDGTLERKICRYNSQLFGTTRGTETYHYDSDERLVYVSAYVTHGSLEDYYIYEGGDEPAYCLTVDRWGPVAFTDRFVKYENKRRLENHEREVINGKIYIDLEQEGVLEVKKSEIAHYVFRTNSTVITILIPQGGHEGIVYLYDAQQGESIMELELVRREEAIFTGLSDLVNYFLVVDGINEDVIITVMGQ